MTTTESAKLERIREVYPTGKPRCPWCSEKAGRHNFDCPAVDVHFLLSTIDALRSEVQRLAEAQGWRPIETVVPDAAVVLIGEETHRGMMALIRWTGMGWATVPGGYSFHPTRVCAVPLPSPPSPRAETT
jgi:hypothetical protein